MTNYLMLIRQHLEYIVAVGDDRSRVAALAALDCLGKVQP